MTTVREPSPWLRRATASSSVTKVRLVATWLFSVYVEEYARYQQAYQAIASYIVLLTWAWVTSLLLLLGGRFNALLVRKWPTRPGARKRHEPHAQLPGPALPPEPNAAVG